MGAILGNRIVVVSEYPIRPQPWCVLSRDRVMLEGKIAKDGGLQQYASVLLELIRLEGTTAVILERTLFMPGIPDDCLIGVENGVRQFCLAGGPDDSPVVGLHVRLWELRFHPVDSKQETFQQATIMALVAGFQRGGFEKYREK